jgi:phosphate transport system substrate-binding protein
MATIFDSSSRLPAAVLALALSTPALAANLAAPAYAPHPVKVSPTQPYVTRDGAVSIVGNDGLEDVIVQLNALFSRAHPAVRFSLRMEGSSTGMPALAAGATAFAPLTRDMWPGDRSAFRQIHGYDATSIRIGYNGHGPRSPAKTPPAVYVHRNNPLPGLSLDQLAQVFTTGSPEGDINLWSQLGLKDEWAPRRIHAYGLRDDGGFATGMRQARMSGRPFAIKYEALPSREAVIRAVATDPYGIALLGWMDAAKVSDQVRILPLAQRSGQPYYGPAYEHVRRGMYPLSAAVQLYVNRAPGQALDPLVKEYLRLALSRQGQAILAAQKDTEEGYVPLSAADLQQELKKLEGL